MPEPLPVDVHNNTRHQLGVEWEFENLEDASVIASPEARLIIRVTQLDDCRP